MGFLCRILVIFIQTATNSYSYPGLKLGANSQNCLTPHLITLSNLSLVLWDILVFSSPPVISRNSKVFPWGTVPRLVEVRSSFEYINWRSGKNYTLGALKITSFGFYVFVTTSVSTYLVPPHIWDSLKIIITGYPTEIQFNVETNLLWGKFLNVRIFNDPTSLLPSYWKETFKYDIIPFNSNVPKQFTLMAGRSYYQTTYSHTS